MTKKDNFRKWMTYPLATFTRLRGEVSEFSLEARIYHSACLATILVMVYVLFFDFLNLRSMAGMAFLCAIPVQLFLFYLSRYKNRTSLSFTIYAIFIHIFFIINYKINGGLAGPALLSFLSVYFLSLAISERRYYIVWTLVNFSAVSMLVCAEFFFPNFVTVMYENRQQQLIDWVSTYAVTMFLLFCCITYIITNYNMERKRAEDWAWELKRLHDEKSRLIEVISHDYQTPLTSIKRYLDITRRYEIESETRISLENELSNTLANTQNLLLNLLEPAKNGSLTTNVIEVFKADDVLQPIITVYADIADKRYITWSNEIAGSIQLESIRSAFSIVIRNLINNAVKYTPESGWIRLNHRKEKDSDLFTVSNSGYITSLADRNMITQYLNNTRRDVPTVGMKIIKQYATLMDAEVYFESSPETGTIFTISVPGTNANKPG